MIVKKCELSPELVASPNLFAGGGSCHDADAADWLGCWLLKAGVAAATS